jgi:TonB family protein
MSGILAGALVALAAAPPRAVQLAEPVYPPAALRANVVGKVLLRLILAPDGAVTSARVLQVDPPGQGFDDVALRAARALRFQPGPSALSYEFRFETAPSDSPSRTTSPRRSRSRGTT